jgi:hypothetical protein
MLEAMSRREHGAVLALAVLPCIVLATVGARSIGALMVAYPASIWGLALALAGAAAMRWIHARRTGVAVALLLALLVPVAGVLGTRYEAGAAGARAVAHSGPILGIHPFQATAVLIDGHGPFDLPVNDYVEPDGHRGYGPEALAAAIELALNDIARIHFADGPARARMAFGEATAVAAWIPAVRETLSREPPQPEQPHFEVTSGTFGRRSRVEFVCPGSRNDPRGWQRASVMKRMCPDKYASEASAGLGVTGRWAGYTEIRGNERLSLARLMSWTRSDDAEGRRIVELEQRAWAWCLLALVLLAFLGRRRATVAGLREVGGAVLLVATIAVVFLALAWAPVLHVGLVERAPPWIDVTRLEPWLPAFALCFGLVELDRVKHADRRSSGGSRWWPGLVFVPVVVVTTTLAGALSAHTWIRPSLRSHDGTFALEALVEHVADRLAVRGGLDVLEMEGAVAASFAVALLAMLAYMPAVVSGALVRDSGRARSRRLLVAAMVLVPAAFLVVSRKTEGASTLVPGAIAMAAVLASGLSLIVQRRRPGAAWRGVAHVAWTLLATALLLETLRGVPEPSMFLLLCVVVGLLAMAASLSLLLRPRTDGRRGRGSAAGSAGGSG